MQIVTRKVTADRNANDVCRCVLILLNQELARKTLFIVFTAGLLTWIVVYSGTSYTAPVDVFVYCMVYSSWITVCLPWLVQNMSGQLLVLIAGVVIRLFAVDVGVLAWSAFRGHRHILHRGLRLKPLFEPSMSWLAEAGYNLRYGVVIAAIVASVASLLLDLFERVNKSSTPHFPRSSFFKRRHFWQLPSNETAWEDMPASKKPRYDEWEGMRAPKKHRHEELEDVHDTWRPRYQDWEDHREIKTSKAENTVRFNNVDATDTLAESIRVRKRGERGRQRNRQFVHVTASSSDSGSEEYEEQTQKRHDVERADSYGSSIHSSRISFKRADEGKGSYRDPCCNKSEFPAHSSLVNDISAAEVDTDPVRVGRVAVEDRSSINTARAKNKSRGVRAQSDSRAGSKRMTTCCGSVDKPYVKRSYKNDKSNEDEEIENNERRNTKDVIEDTLNESLLSLRKLREK